MIDGIYQLLARVGFTDPAPCPCHPHSHRAGDRRVLFLLRGCHLPQEEPFPYRAPRLHSRVHLRLPHHPSRGDGLAALLQRCADPAHKGENDPRLGCDGSPGGGHRPRVRSEGEERAHDGDLRACRHRRGGAGLVRGPARVRGLRCADGGSIGFRAGRAGSRAGGNRRARPPRVRQRRHPAFAWGRGCLPRTAGDATPAGRMWSSPASR